jgi:hypothetical protein
MAAADHRVNPGMVKYRKLGTEGTSWCGSCQDFRPIDQFTKNPSKWTGLDSRCKDCTSLHNARRDRRRAS